MAEYIKKADLYAAIAIREEEAVKKYLSNPNDFGLRVSCLFKLNESLSIKHIIADFPAIEIEEAT